jgi:beta-galactosidase
MPAPPHVLDVCDELGMLVIDESAIYASWQMLMPEHPGWMAHCREHLTRWVRRDRNHPSVILWSAENEGLNVSALTPAMLAEFRRIIDAADGGRPVIFDGDGTACGTSPASVKHYVKTIEDLKDRGGRFPEVSKGSLAGFHLDAFLICRQNMACENR